MYVLYQEELQTSKFWIKQENDYDVEISAYVTGRTQTAIYSEAYKILKQDGKVVSSELLSKDTYKDIKNLPTI